MVTNIQRIITELILNRRPCLQRCPPSSRRSKVSFSHRLMVTNIQPFITELLRRSKVRFSHRLMVTNIQPIITELLLNR